MNGQLVVSAPETLLLTDDGRFPNSQLPVLLYRLAQMDELVAKLEARDWTNIWFNGIYSYHHYHSTAHELLVVLDGQATLVLGGDSGKRMELNKGMALVLPAGTAHKRLSASRLFSVLGAYPRGQSYDLMVGEPDERPAADERIATVKQPTQDPFGVSQGGLLELWK